MISKAEHRQTSARRKTAWLAALFLTLSFPPKAASAPPELSYRADDTPLHLPEGMNFGEVAGVAINSHKHVFVFSRGGNGGGPAFGAAAAQLLEFGPDGTFIREIGRGLYAWSFAHAVRIDPDDNIWATDKGSDTVVEFTPQGRVKAVFGRKQEAGDATGPHRKGPPWKPAEIGRFRQPTNVAWGVDGRFYISDGYINARVAMFDRDGAWLGSFGDHGTGPGQFNNVHDIAVSRAGEVFVADRANQRIQVFSPEGRFLRVISIDVAPPNTAQTLISPTEDGPAPADDHSFEPGSPWAICISPDQTLWVADAVPGRIYRLTLQGEVTGYLGSSGRGPGQFGWIHELACPDAHTLWTAELLTWRVQKLTVGR